jgi:ABC-2 type transport system permease protein
MRRALRLMGGIISVSLQRDLAYRAEIGVRVGLSILSALGTAVSLAAVYSHVDNLAGWTFGEAILVLGMFMVMSAFVTTFIEPNLEWFSQKIRDGLLDDILLKPVPGIFLTSFATTRPWSLVDAVVGGAVIWYGLRSLDAAIGVTGVAMCVGLLVVGAVAAWALRFITAIVAFWAVGLELSVFWYTPWTLGRYPVDAYGRAARFALTYVIPVAFVSTFPARALTRGPSVTLVAGGALTAVVAATTATLLWRAGLRRYTSATS